MYSHQPVSGTSKSRTLQRLLVGFISACLMAGVSVGTVSSADAVSKPRANKVLKVAKKLKGTPYRWGGTSKKGFDCSGYTQYVFKKALHKKLPRTAGGQAHVGKHINHGHKKKGDLIVFTSGGYAYHVGIYAGDGKVWHSPRTGQRVKKEKIWTSGYTVRRVK